MVDGPTKSQKRGKKERNQNINKVNKESNGRKRYKHYTLVFFFESLKTDIEIFKSV